MDVTERPQQRTTTVQLGTKGWRISGTDSERKRQASQYGMYPTISRLSRWEEGFRFRPRPPRKSLPSSQVQRVGMRIVGTDSERKRFAPQYGMYQTILRLSRWDEGFRFRPHPHRKSPTKLPSSTSKLS